MGSICPRRFAGLWSSPSPEVQRGEELPLESICPGTGLETHSSPVFVAEGHGVFVYIFICTRAGI